ncbi:MAG: ATP-binding cassette domain-containing protein [Clostridia bacterium]
MEQALHITGLSELANRRVGCLSGGMKRRLEIARALLNHLDVRFEDNCRL